MNRLITAGLILGLGSALIGILHAKSTRLESHQRRLFQEWTAKNALVIQTQSQVQAMHQTNQKAQAATAGIRTDEAPPQQRALYGLTAATNLTAAQSEALLQDLGFDWNSQEDYLVVSKQALAHLNYRAASHLRAEKPLCQLLAITTEERSQVETTLESIRAQHAAWVQEHLQRGEPHGNTLASYTLPAVEPSFIQTLEAQLSAGVISALGEERSRLFSVYSSGWTAELGLASEGSSTLAIQRSGKGNATWLLMQLSGPSGSMSCDITPVQSFPEAFLPAFPNGWRDLALREGFELPQSFHSQKPVSQ